MLLKQFKHFEGLSVTIHTNNNCTCKCSYCYEIGKAGSISEDHDFWNTTKHKDEKRSYNFIKKECKPKIIEIDKVKAFIDQILDFPESEFFKEFITTAKDNLIIDFIGGDSLQYPEIVDETLTYLVQQLMKRNHKWMAGWRSSISSNGITLMNPKARKICEKWKNNLSLGISIDGCPELHDLNRWCFADNEDGTHRGSWQYIKEIWPWYTKHFPYDSEHTKWTLAPNSYKYLFDSVKFLHEELKMKHLMFNRVMEDEIQDSAEEIWELIQQFEKVMEYIIQHHTRVYCSPFDYNNTQFKTKSILLEDEPTYTRCGFGRMPTLSLDGNVYPCFRMVPGSNHLADSSKYSQGTFDNILKNESRLKELNINSRAVNMRNENKCESCEIYNLCPHCAADCVGERDGILTKTSSVCNFARLTAYYARKYWSRIKYLHPSQYSKITINWTENDQDKLYSLILNDIVNLKNNRRNR